MDDVDDPHARIKALPAGSRIDEKYVIVRRLGAGGMGVVYQCNNELIDKPVAVKVLTSTDPGIITRFRREAKVSERLRRRHGAFVEIFDMGSFDGYPYLVMELLQGSSLFDCLYNGRVTAESYLAIHLECCSALQAAHDNGVVHRDLKPENIFIEESGRVRILDLGIAKLLQPGDGMQTGTHALMGTPQFMSPEQCRGAKLIDHRSDIYSLALVAYWIYSGGRMPFQPGEGQFDWIVAHVRDQPLPLGSLAPRLPPGLVAAIHRALEKDPASRYQTMAEMRAAFAGFLVGDAVTVRETALPTLPGPSPSGPSTPPGTSPSGPMSLAKGEISQPAPARRRGPAIAVGLVLATLAGGGVWWARSSPPPAAPIAAAPAPVAAAPQPVAAAPQPVAAAPQPVAAPPVAPPAPDAKTRHRAATGQIIINVKPWATCTLGGKSQETPCNFRLPPGTHKIVLSNQALKKREEIKATLEGGEVKKLDYDWRQ
jgi:serine/threonine-protein kinase